MSTEKCQKHGVDFYEDEEDCRNCDGTGIDSSDDLDNQCFSCSGRGIKVWLICDRCDLEDLEDLDNDS